MAHHVQRLVFLLIARTVVNEMLYPERNFYISLLHSAPSTPCNDFVIQESEQSATKYLFKGN